MDKATYSAPPPSDVLLFQLQRIVTNLFKRHLVELETLGQLHDEALDKLVKVLPKEYQVYVELADYLTPERGEILRKKTLDEGNDAWREIQQLLKQYEVDFKR